MQPDQLLHGLHPEDPEPSQEVQRLEPAEEAFDAGPPSVQELEPVVVDRFQLGSLDRITDFKSSEMCSNCSTKLSL